MNKYALNTLDQIEAAANQSAATPIVKGFLDSGSLAVLGGSSKAGKSSLVTNLAFAVAHGSPFLGMPTTPGAVLWISYEESKAERWHILRHYSKSDQLLHGFDFPPIDSDEGIEAIREAATAHQASLVIIDPLAAAVKSDNLSETVKTRQALQGINDLRRDLGVTIVVLHHHNKANHRHDSPDRMADSHQICSIATQFWNMDFRVKPEGRRITLQGRGRHENGDKKWVILSTNDHTFELDASAPDRPQPKSSRILAHDKLLELMEQGNLYSLDELTALYGKAKGTVQNLLADLCKQGRVRSTKFGGTRAFSYYLPGAGIRGEAA
ncbi:MAG TPA: AAA family ATPase [Fimbriimonadaceae bacterium]|nr:AAA family ATPase [Fimbriimonadaceae bacterium]